MCLGFCNASIETCTFSRGSMGLFGNPLQSTAEVIAAVGNVSELAYFRVIESGETRNSSSFEPIVAECTSWTVDVSALSEG